MNMEPLGGLVGSAAGAPLSQTAGSEAERARKDSINQHRQATGNEKAEQAAGIGQTEQDQESSERDADGRRLWEGPHKPNSSKDENEPDAETTARQSKDATGLSGTRLDLTG